MRDRSKRWRRLTVPEVKMMAAESSPVRWPVARSRSCPSGRRSERKRY
jgi:hypothetical protein